MQHGRRARRYNSSKIDSHGLSSIFPAYARVRRRFVHAARESAMGSSYGHIGFVGAGRMGANMARRLNETGYAVTAVYDLNPAKSASLGNELGCEAVTTPAYV